MTKFGLEISIRFLRTFQNLDPDAPLHCRVRCAGAFFSTRQSLSLTEVFQLSRWVMTFGLHSFPAASGACMQTASVLLRNSLHVQGHKLFPKPSFQQHVYMPSKAPRSFKACTLPFSKFIHNANSGNQS